MSAKVFDELTCPDCGGQIGGSAAPGIRACRCFDERPAPKRRVFVDDPDPIDMLPLEPMMDGANAPAVVGKPCRICGKDLTGRTRMKDDLGYICKPCSDAEFAAEVDAERDAMQCPECKRKLKPGAFEEYRGSLICKRCKADHADMDRTRVGKVKLTKHDEEEKRTLKRYALIFTILVVLGLITLAMKH